MSGTRDNRDDVAQEDPIIQLWRSFSVRQSATRFSTWMYHITSSVAISFYAPREHESTICSSQREILEAIDEAEGSLKEIQFLYEFIDGLDPLNKALVLLYLDGNNYQEIAEVLGDRETRCGNSKISRLKSKMKQEFRGTGHQEIPVEETKKWMNSSRSGRKNWIVSSK